MVSDREHVNDKSSYLRTFSVRLIEERKRLSLSQADFGLQAGVGRTTQVKYESGEGEPGAYYFYRLEAMNVDVRYLISGVRSTELLGDELQNLVEAYADASEELKNATFAVLVSDRMRVVRKSRHEPGWYRYELRGEDDLRYPQHYERTLQSQSGGDGPLPGEIKESRRPQRSTDASED